MDDAVRAAILRVMKEIPDARSKALVTDVLRHALSALSDLTNLDDSIYTHVTGDTAIVDLKSGGESDAALREAALTDVQTKSFRGIFRLTTLLVASGILWEDSFESSVSVHPAEGELEFDDSFDFALDAAMISAPPPRVSFSGLDELDIDRAFDFVTRGEEPKTQGKSEHFREQIGTLGHALRKEAMHHDGRVRAALLRGQHDLVLRELDGARESLTEGLFAVVSMTFQIFLGESTGVDRAVLVPGYKTALDQALTIRRSLTALRGVVASENEVVIQDDTLPDGVHVEAMDRVAIELQSFMGAQVFRMMRATDRLELGAFQRTISRGAAEERRLACEGLTKYLESLSIISQREVLQQHDREVLTASQQTLEAARSVLAVSETGASSLLREVMDQAGKLEGRNPSLDELVQDFQANKSAFRSREAMASLIESLEDLLR